MAWWEGVDETRVLIAQDPSTSGKHHGSFLSLRHPRTGNTACYLYVDGVLQELHWFKQSYGSWFLGDYVCEDGRLYTATPVDPVFILLPVFEEARMKKGNEPGKFRQLDDIIYIQGFPGYQSLLSVAEKAMQVVCDLQEVGSTKFFRLNDSKVLKWLCYKVQQLKQTLPTLDKNFAARNEKDTLLDAVSIMREYLKEEPWMNNLCNKLKLNLEDTTNAQDVGTLLPPTGNDLGAFTPIQENNGKGKKVSRPTTRQQAKKGKVEKDSQNIKDMFSRATRKRGTSESDDGEVSVSTRSSRLIGQEVDAQTKGKFTMTNFAATTTFTDKEYIRNYMKMANERLASIAESKAKIAEAIALKVDMKILKANLANMSDLARPVYEKLLAQVMERRGL